MLSLLPDAFGSWVINLFPYIRERRDISQEEVVLRHNPGPRMSYLPHSIQIHFVIYLFFMGKLGLTGTNNLTLT